MKYLQPAQNKREIRLIDDIDDQMRLFVRGRVDVAVWDPVHEQVHRLVKREVQRFVREEIQ